MDLSVKFSDLCGYTHRVGELVSALKECQCVSAKRAATEYGSAVMMTNGSATIALNNITVLAPGSDRRLMEDLSVTFRCTLIDIFLVSRPTCFVALLPPFVRMYVTLFSETAHQIFLNFL